MLKQCIETRTVCDRIVEIRRIERWHGRFLPVAEVGSYKWRNQLFKMSLFGNKSLKLCCSSSCSDMLKSSASLLTLSLVMLWSLAYFQQSFAFLIHDDMGYGRFRLPDGSFLYDEYYYDYDETQEGDDNKRLPRSLPDSPPRHSKFKVNKGEKMANLKRRKNRI